MPKIGFSKRYKVPRKPFDKDRLIDEHKLVGYHGLKNKKELWTFIKISNSVKTRAKDLLISPDKNQQIILGRLLLNKLVAQGILNSVDLNSLKGIINALNSVLNLTEADFLERRLQYRIYQMGIAKDVHEARNMIYHKHISIKGFVVNKPGYLVKADEESLIEIYKFSSKAGAKKSRRSRKAKENDNEDDE